MRLYAWLNRNDVTVKDFAQKIGARSLSTVYRYMRGERLPSAVHYQRILELTNNEVTLDDFKKSQEWWRQRNSR